MHGPTCISWANLTPFSLQERYYHVRTAKALMDCDLTFLTKQEVWKIAQDYPVCSLWQQEVEHASTFVTRSFDKPHGP